MTIGSGTRLWTPQSEVRRARARIRLACLRLLPECLTRSSSAAGDCCQQIALRAQWCRINVGEFCQVRLSPTSVERRRRLALLQNRRSVKHHWCWHRRHQRQHSYTAVINAHARHAVSFKRAPKCDLPIFQVCQSRIRQTFVAHRVRLLLPLCTQQVIPAENKYFSTAAIPIPPCASLK